MCVDFAVIKGHHFRAVWHSELYTVMLRSSRATLRCGQRLLAVRSLSTPSIPQLSTTGWDPLSVITYPGSRALELCRPDSGNTITESILQTIKSKMELYSEIETISAVMVTSMSPEFFSSGLQSRFLEDRTTRKQFVSTANELSELFGNSDKETVGVFSGEIDSTVFGIFATAKHRLGTDSTRFRMSDLLNGRLPIGGGIAHHLANTSPQGYALARYLAVSGRTLSAHDLYMLGLVTHVVSQEMTVDTFASTLATTLSEFDNYKAEQKSVVDKTAITQLLDTMHVYMGEVDVAGREAPASGEDSVAGLVAHWKESARASALIPEEQRQAEREEAIQESLAELHATLGKRVGKKVYLTKKDKQKLALEESNLRDVDIDPVEHADTCVTLLEQGDLQLKKHHVWDKVTLVRPQDTNIDLYFDDEEARERAEDLEDVLEEVLHCFSADSVAECRKRVQQAARTAKGVTVGDWTQENWAVRALAQWDTITEPAIVEEWFRMTKAAASGPIANYYKLEVEKA